MPLLALPAELLLEIIGFVTGWADLGNLRLTNRQLAAFGEPFLYQAFVVKCGCVFTRAIEFGEMIDANPARASRTKAFTYGWIMPHTRRALRFLLRLPALQHLTFNWTSHCSATGLNILQSEVPLGKPLFGINYLLPEEWPELPTVRRMTIRGGVFCFNGPAAVIFSAPNVEFLHFSHSSSLVPSPFYEAGFARPLLALTTLRITDYHITDFWLERLFRNAPNLKRLIYESEAKFLHSRGFAKMLGMLAGSLEELYIRRPARFEGEIVLEGLRDFKKLRLLVAPIELLNDLVHGTSLVKPFPPHLERIHILEPFP